jgi:hypothetical protein
MITELKKQASKFKLATAWLLIALAVAASCFSVLIMPSRAEAAGSCTLSPPPGPAGAYLNGASVSISPPAFSGSLISMSPSVFHVPAATLTGSPPPDLWNFNEDQLAPTSGTATYRYRNAEGVHTESCLYSIPVRLRCRTFDVAYGYYDEPCAASASGDEPGGEDPSGDDFSLVCNPISRTVAAGESTSYAVTVIDVSFGASVLVTVQSNTPFIQGSPRRVTQSGVVPVTVSASTPQGSYSLAFAATREDTGDSAQAFCQLRVENPDTPYLTPSYTSPYNTPYATPDQNSDFIIACGPPTRTVFAGSSSQYFVQVTSIAPIAESITLSVAVSPPGKQSPQANIVPASVSAPGFATATVFTTGSTNSGRYQIQIRAVYRAVVKTCIAELVVVSTPPVCPPKCPPIYTTPNYATPVYATPPPAANLSTSDKDIVEVNGVVNVLASSANGLSDVPANPVTRCVSRLIFLIQEAFRLPMSKLLIRF